ncbi:MAG: Maf-like protein [Nocardiaceae bacterium]|nr:Maf-like protein [Nocardiaceae bacterium]
MTRLVLGSASPARLSVLRAAGVDPLVVVSEVDEDAIIAAMPPGVAPEAVVTELAEAKARDVAAGLDVEDCVVVGCDSMLLINGELQGKPLTAESARSRWETMAGRTGHLLTGHCVLRIVDGRVTTTARGENSTVVHFARPDARDLDAYIGTGEPLNVAGAFTLDGLGGWFIEKIEGDPSSVIGISLPLMRRLLAGVGVNIAELWLANPQPVA